MFRIEILRVAGFRFKLLVQIMPPEIAPSFHRQFRASALIDNYVANIGAIFKRLIHRIFETNFFAAPPTAIGRDYDRRAKILNPGFQRFRRESAEHHTVNNAEPRACKHGDRKLWNHRHINHCAIIGPIPQPFQDTCEAAYQSMQFLIGDGTLIAGLAFPNECGLVLTRCREMPVQAVIAGINFATGEPFGRWRVPFKRLRKRTKPSEFLPAHIAPEGFRVLLRAFVQIAILLDTVYLCMGNKVRTGRVNFRITHGKSAFQRQCNAASSA